MVLDRLPVKWKWPFIFVASAIVIIVLLALTKPEPKKSDIREKEWLVSATALSFEARAPELELLGVVQTPFDSQLSAAISADVNKVPVREGQHVKQGDVLIDLDKRDIELSLAQKEADVADVQAQIQNEKNRYQADLAALEQEKALMAIAKKAVQRQAKLQKSNLVAQERYDQAASEQARNALAVTSRELAIQDHPARIAQLQARLARAEAALKNAQLDAERSTIMAPFDGVITQVNVAPGERVQTGQSLLSLYDQSAMEIRAQIPDRFVTPVRLALSEQHEITAKVDNYGRTGSLVLSRLSGKANRGSGGIDALFLQREAEIPLILNSTLKLHATLPPLQNVASLPVTAIYGTDRVYRIEDGRIKAHTVEILGKQFLMHDVDRVLIRSETLKAGDQIITTQLPNAISGLKVNVREPSDV